MITVQQAIYGDQNGAYALLMTSMASQHDAMRIANQTDFRERPAEGIEWSPALRGFAYDRWYLLIKTFLDPSPGLRTGRTFSHVLILQKADLSAIDDLRPLFDLFPEEIDKTTPLQSIQLDETRDECDGLSIPNLSRGAKLINALLKSDDYRNTIVWVGADGFADQITVLWRNAPKGLRESIRFGLAVSPRDFDGSQLNLVCIPGAVTANWLRTGFCIIHAADAEPLNGPAAFYLAGHPEDALGFSELLRLLQIIPAAYTELSYLQDIAAMLARPTEMNSLNRLVPIVDLLSKFSPNPAKGEPEKEKLLGKLLSLLSSGTGKQIASLRNVDWVGFRDAETQLTAEVGRWLDGHLLAVDNDEGDIVLSVALAADAPSSWWTALVRDCFKRKLAEWKHSYARPLWRVWVAYPLLDMDSYLPGGVSVEMDLIGLYGREVPSELLRAVIGCSRKRNWLILHAASVARAYPVEEALALQLAIDPDPSHSAGVVELLAGVDDRTVIGLGLKTGELRTIDIAAARVRADRFLLADLRVEDKLWQLIWKKSIQNGDDFWQGIKNPREVLFALLDQLVNGLTPEMTLLEEVSVTAEADLSGYPKRKQVWPRLSARARQNFLQSTVLPIAKQLVSHQLAVGELESEVIYAFSDPALLSVVVLNKDLLVTDKVKLFESVPQLSSTAFIGLLEQQKLDAEASMLAGQLITGRRWSDAANFIADRVTYRPDLQPALIECKGQLDFFKKAWLRSRGYFKKDWIRSEEWWEAFLQVCYQLYPGGPTERGIWEQAGGEVYDLVANVSGRESWMKALKRLQLQAIEKPTVKKLLTVMGKESPYNDQLKTLTKLYDEL